MSFKYFFIASVSDLNKQFNALLMITGSYYKRIITLASNNLFYF